MSYARFRIVGDRTRFRKIWPSSWTLNTYDRWDPSRKRTEVVVRIPYDLKAIEYIERGRNEKFRFRVIFGGFSIELLDPRLDWVKCMNQDGSFFVTILGVHCRTRLN